MATWRFWFLLALRSGQISSSFAGEQVFAAQPKMQARDELSLRYGIQALDRTDEHSPVVLRNLLFLLDHAFPPDFTKSLKNFRYLYAYAGHDQAYELGAFHPEEKAISIGGKLAYPDASKTFPDVAVLTTLAHELGHAVLLEKLSPQDLRSIGEKYGGWAPVFLDSHVEDFYSRPFFLSHPKFGKFARELAGEESWKENSVCSALATKNIHEWFADAFAAVVMKQLGANELLGKGWRERLIKTPKSSKEYWVNYNFVSGGFTHWLVQRMKSLPDAKAIQE